ncbi:MAG: sigma-70 family RNA polymerase sigma factor [Bacteroides sp.]
MNEPNRTQWEIRCAFNGFCKKALKYEGSNAHRDVRRHQMHEVTFSDLAPQEEEQLYTVDRYLANEEADNSFRVAGKKITPELLADALHTLPEEKRNAVLLYYFFKMSDAEIAKLYDIPRSTVQYRRTSSFELLKRYLEERAYDDENEW